MLFRRLFFALMFLVLVPLGTLAMDFQLEELNDGHAGLTYTLRHPNLEYDLDSTPFTGVHLFRALVPVGEESRLLVGLPMLVADFDHDETDKTTAFGNLFVGYLAPPIENTKTRFLVGMRLPTAQDIHYVIVNMGVYTDYLHMTRYLEDTLTLRLGVVGEKGGAEGPYFRWGVLPELMKYTGNGGGDVEVQMNYGMGLGLRGGVLEMGAEVAGTYFASGGGSRNFGQRSHHQLSLGFQVDLGAVTPGISYTFPLDDDLYSLENTLNAHLKFRR